MRDALRHHVHEYHGITCLSASHSHTCCGMTGQAVFLPDGSHFHMLDGNTSSHGSHGTHYHIVIGTTGSAQPSSGGGHCHFIAGATTPSGGHKHDYILRTSPCA